MYSYSVDSFVKLESLLLFPTEAVSIPAHFVTECATYKKRFVFQPRMQQEGKALIRPVHTTGRVDRERIDILLPIRYIDAAQIGIV